MIQHHTFPNGGYVLHKISLGKFNYSAWFDARGALQNAERSGGGGIPRNGPKWRQLEVIGKRYLPVTKNPARGRQMNTTARQKALRMLKGKQVSWLAGSAGGLQTYGDETGAFVRVKPSPRKRGKNPLTMAVDRKSGTVRATYVESAPRLQVEIRPGKWIDWSKQRFASVRAAMLAGKRLLKKHRRLARYRFRVLAGKRKKNPRNIAAAQRLYRGFRERAPGRTARVQLDVPKAAAVVGRAEFIGYTTTHGRKVQPYRHDFAPGSRPLIAAGPKRGQVYLVGDRHKFTARGIVDLDAQGREIDD